MVGVVRNVEAAHTEGGGIARARNAEESVAAVGPRKSPDPATLIAAQVKVISVTKKKTFSMIIMCILHSLVFGPR